MWNDSNCYSTRAPFLTSSPVFNQNQEKNPTTPKHLIWLCKDHTVTLQNISGRGF